MTEGNAYAQAEAQPIEIYGPFGTGISFEFWRNRTDSEENMGYDPRV